MNLSGAVEDLEYLEILYVNAFEQSGSKKPLHLIVIDTGQESSKLKEYGTAFCKYQFLDLDVETVRSHAEDLNALITTMACSVDFMRDDRLKRWYPIQPSPFPLPNH